MYSPPLLYYLHEASEHWISSHFSIHWSLLRWKSRRDCEIFFAFIWPFSFIGRGKNKTRVGTGTESKTASKLHSMRKLKTIPFLEHKEKLLHLRFDKKRSNFQQKKSFLTLAPIWFPHWPACRWTISRMMSGVNKSRLMFSDHRVPEFLPCATDVILGCGENNTFDRSRERNA